MPPDQPVELLGSREDVAVRVLSEADADALFGAIDRSREHLRPWFSFVDVVVTRDDALAFTRRVQTNVRDSGRFWAGIWREGRFCGSLGLTRLDDENRHAEFGIWLARDAPAGGRRLAPPGSCSTSSSANTVSTASAPSAPWATRAASA